jgi:PAS domain S-box-containing protein
MSNLEKVDILIVDDRDDGLIALEAVLQDLPGVRLVRAQSGEEALQLLHDYDFAVILLDVQMPQMDGFEVAQTIRRDYRRYKHTPIIFVTAISKEDRYVYKGYDVGAVDYIFKPFEPRVLRSKVSVFVDLYLKSRQLHQQSEKLRESEMRDRYLKLTELELESLKRYRTLADAIPHIVWKAKVDGTVDYFNKVWTNYTGLTQEQSLGASWQDCFDPEDLKHFLKTWINAMDSGNEFELEARLKNKKGEFRWHWIRAVPEVRHFDVVAWLGTCTDIHDRKLSEARLLEAQKVAVEANLAKTSFLANMSHEIRTPMGAILGFTELMLAPNQTEEDRLNAITTIRRNGQHLLYIIDEILDISKVESGHLETENLEINFPSLMEEVKTFLGVQAKSKGLGLEFYLEGAVPEVIHSDALRLRQILLNIIGNALKFTEKGKVSVYASWDERQSQMLVRVNDTGIGIDETYLHRLFQPFAQMDYSTTRRFGGTGLGLALSRKLAQALGGDVTLACSEPGKGSTFEIRIEVGVKTPVNWVTHLPGNDSAQKLIRRDEEQKLKNTRVLVVDDSPDNQVIIGFFLGAAGASVDYADNGEQGVDKAMLGDYNMVLMDIQMPEVDGYEATRRLRSRGFEKPIVALTAHALKEERDRCLSAGCNDHFTKPVDRSKLITLVERYSAPDSIKQIV